MSFDLEPLLEGLEGRDRQARRELLVGLADEGVSPAELAAAVAGDRLVLLPLERMLGGRHTAREVESETGLPAEMLLRFHRLLGLADTGPDERAFSDEDIEAAQATRLFLESGMSESSISEMVRVLGESMARVAGTTAAAFSQDFLEPGDTERDAAMRFAGLAEKLAPAAAPVLTAAFNAHLREAVTRGMLSRAEVAAGQPAGSGELAVCFADLVGFTRLGSQVEIEELGLVARTLATLASELTEPPVRLVKTIGDAAMFVCPQAEPLVALAIALVAAAERADLPALRAGIACGPAIARAGDYYGHSVNLASRVTGIARAGSVLVTEEVHEAVGDRFSWSFAGRHRLKGIAKPVPTWRARPPVETGSEEAAAESRDQAR